VSACTGRDWKEKATVEGELAGETGGDFAVSRDLPGLFDEEDDETALGARTSIHSMPRLLLRATAWGAPRPPSSRPQAAVPSLVIATPVPAEDGNPVTHSRVRRSVPVRARLSVRGQSMPRWAWRAGLALLLVSLVVLVTVVTVH
jgi:hypothetical protein